MAKALRNAHVINQQPEPEVNWDDDTAILDFGAILNEPIRADQFITTYILKTCLITLMETKNHHMESWVVGDPVSVARCIYLHLFFTITVSGCFTLHWYSVWFILNKLFKIIIRKKIWFLFFLYSFFLNGKWLLFIVSIGIALKIFSKSEFWY